MKHFLFLLGAFMLFNATIAKAQDTLYLKNGDIKVAKILKITPQEVIYKDFSNLEGPDYLTEKNAVSGIHYKNGSKDIFEPEAVEYVNDHPVKEKYTANMEVITLNTFKTYNDKYNYYKNKPYENEPGDKLNPWLSVLASYFVPGLGQIISGETGRGFAFMGGIFGASIITMVGYAGLISNPLYGESYYTQNTNSNRSLYSSLAIGGAVASAGLAIWNLVDAYQVAKINNLFYRDVRDNQLKVTLTPSIMPSGDFASNSLAFGAKLSIHL